MTEYTSLEISKRLRDANFRIGGDTTHWEAGVKFTDPGENMWRYRSDTLLAWLLKKGIGVYIDKKGDTYYIYDFDATSTDSYIAASLPDVLAEVVLNVLEVSG